MSRARLATSSNAGPTVEADLGRLDPWSFWTLPGEGFGVDHVVVGTTGAYVVAVSDEAVEMPKHEHAQFSLKVRHPRRFRRAARLVRRRLLAATVHTDVRPILCFSNSPDFAPRTVRGVRVVSRSMLLREIADRDRSISANQARRAMTSLRKVAAPEV
jgi:hypothetical protein